MNYYYKLLILILSIIFLCNSCEDFFLSEVDECGVIDGDNSICADCAGVPNGNAAHDCTGVCNGSAVTDICGICDGDGSSCDECLERADNNACNFPDCNQFFDCADVCGGSTELDICGVCDGNNETCMIYYSTTIQPILNTHCIGCHGTSASVVLESYENVLSFVEPGDSTSSLLWQVIGGPNPTMPQNQIGTVSDDHINKIALWIQLGAEEN